jgi:hypothetical protein
VVAAWTTGDGRTVGTYAQEGGCGRSEAKPTAQTDQQVTILLMEVIPKPDSRTMCTMDIRYPKVSVTLDAPLGERRIVLERTQVVQP